MYSGDGMIGVRNPDLMEAWNLQMKISSRVKCVGLASLELENVADECQSIRANWILRAVSMVASIIANARTGNSA